MNRRRGSLRAWARRGFVSLGVIVLALAGAEISLTLAKPAPAGYPPGLFVADEARSYALSPGFTGIVDEGRPYAVATNSRGYRDVEWSGLPLEKVLLVGDGVAFGAPLAFDETIVAQLRRRAPESLAVLNAAVPGYGVRQILATIVRECGAIRPRAIVYLYWWNDAERSAVSDPNVTVIDGYLAPRRDASGAPLTDAEMRRKADERRAAPSWTLAEAVTLTRVRALLSQNGWHPRQIVERWVGLERLSDQYVQRYAASRDPAFYAPTGIKAAAEMIEQMRLEAQRCGADFLMLVLPNYAEAYYGLREPATEAVLAALPSVDGKIIDLRAECPRGTVLPLPGDGHYSPAAAAWVADRLAFYLKAYGRS